MKQTAIHRIHLSLKAKLAEFRGWQTPSLFRSIPEEYNAARHAAGLFDIGYLGRIEILGSGALDLLQKVFTRDVSVLSDGSSAFGVICSEEGFILTDAVLFRLPPAGAGSGSRFLITVSPENAEKTVGWLTHHAGEKAAVTDRTEFTGHFALLGPKSSSILEQLAAPHFKKIRLKHVKELSLAGTAVIVARMGWFGEDGYEFIAAADHAETLWNRILDIGKESGVIACGLECRNLLRMERGFPLYGNDFDETRTPLEAGLASFVDLKKEFIGRDGLLRLKAGGVRQKLVGFTLTEKEAPRIGGSIFSENHEIGIVTSGALSPAMLRGIGLGYVLSRYAQPGQEVDVEGKDREIAAKVVAMPFYRKK